VSYFGQLQRFDPKLGEIPNGPVPGMPSIAFRSRQLLNSRTSEQIHSVAKAIDFAIYEHFNELEENEIQRLRSDLEAILSIPRRGVGALLGIAYITMACFRDFQYEFPLSPS
jgi:hypothetical protein